jgi:predicted glycoside hydrolase/deacetylase ChbG (UPF0249 family)
VLYEVALELALPLRHKTPAIRYSGDFYGRSSTGAATPEIIAADNLIQIITDLPPGTTELACHPGEGGDIPSEYNHERSAELDSLCDPRVRAAIEREGIELRSFKDAL